MGPKYATGLLDSVFWNTHFWIIPLNTLFQSLKGMAMVCTSLEIPYAPMNELCDNP